MFNIESAILIGAVEEVVKEAMFTKKRVFNRIKISIKNDVNPNIKVPKDIYITVVAEPKVFGSSIYLGEDILVKDSDYFTTSVIEQSKHLEGLYDEPTIQ